MKHKSIINDTKKKGEKNIMVRKFKTEKGQLVYVVPIEKEDSKMIMKAIIEVARFKKERVKNCRTDYHAELGRIAKYKDGLDGVWFKKDLSATVKSQPCVMVCAARRADSIFKA